LEFHPAKRRISLWILDYVLGKQPGRDSKLPWLRLRFDQADMQYRWGVLCMHLAQENIRQQKSEQGSQTDMMPQIELHSGIDQCYKLNSRQRRRVSSTSPIPCIVCVL
jgi:hypothetical protein